MVEYLFHMYFLSNQERMYMNKYFQQQNMHHHLNMDYFYILEYWFHNFFLKNHLDNDKYIPINLLICMFPNFDMVEMHMVHKDIDIEDP